MQNYTTQKKNSNGLFSLLTLMLANALIAVIYLFYVRNSNYTFVKNGEPLFALKGELLFWITFGMIIVLGVVPYMLFNKSHFQTNRAGLRLNYILYYIHFFIFLLWAMFGFMLNLPLPGLIVLGVCIALGIFVVYRFMTNTIVAGVLLCFWILWLIYLFILNLAYVLL